MTNKETPTLSYWATTFGLLLVALTPCIISFNLYFPYITGKAFYFRTLVILMVATYLFAAWQTRQQRIKLSPILISFTALLVVTGISAALADEGIKSLWSNFERMEGVVGFGALWLLFVIAGSVWRSLWSWATYAYAWLAINAIVALRGIYEMVIALQNGQVPRVDSFLGNPTYFASAMLLSVFIAASLYFVPQLLAYRWVAYIGIPLYVIGIIGTGTRGTALGLMAGVIVALLLYALRKEASKRIRLIAIIIPIAAVLGIGGLFLTKDSAFVQSLPLFGRIAQIADVNPESQARPALWNMALKGLSDKPIFGWGLENFNYVFNTYYDPAIANHEQWFDRAHNVFFDWLVATGVVGFALYLFLIGSTVWCAWRLTWLSSLQKSIVTGAVVAYIIHNSFVFDNLISAIMFYSFAAFIHSQYVVQREVRQAETRGKEQKEIRLAREVADKKIGYVYAALFFVSLIAVPVGVGAVVVMPLTTNKLLLDGYSYLNAITSDMSADAKKSAFKIGADAFTEALKTEWLGAQEVHEQYIQSASSLAVAFGQDAAIGQDVMLLAAAAQQQTKAYIEKYPKNARFYFLLATSFKQLGRNEEALAALDRAIEFSPKKASFYEEKVMIYLTQHQASRAVETAQQTLALNESNSRAQTLYVIALAENAQFADASKYIAAHPSVFDDAKVIQVYLEKNRFADVVVGLSSQLPHYDPSKASIYNAGTREAIAQKYLAYAASLLELGRRDEALAAMANARQFLIDNPSQLSFVDSLVAAVKAGKPSILR